MNSGASVEVTELGVMEPAQKKTEVLKPGEVGYLCGGIKSVDDARVGDTVTLTKAPAEAPLGEGLL